MLPEAGSGAGASERIREIADIILTKNRIAVLTHNSADGDTLGSALAACLALRKLGKDASLVYEEAFPGHLSVLLFDKSIFSLYREGTGGGGGRPDSGGGDGNGCGGGNVDGYAGGEHDSNVGGSWDAVITFDTAGVKLLGKRVAMLSQTDCVINVDHHITNENFGHYNLIDTNASSTAEIAFELIQAMGVELDCEIALAVYTGVCTDTGGFGYSNTTARSHEIAAKALECDIDVSYLRYKFFDEISSGKLQLYGYVARELKIVEDGRLAIVVVPARALKEIGASEEDCDGLVNIGRNIAGVEVSVFARETQPGEFRINLRSRGGYDVAEAARMLGGGGHKAAAGCTVFADPSLVEGILLSAVTFS